MSKFETVLVNSFNEYFKKNGIAALAYRIRHARFQQQFCDILIDSADQKFYSAIESKTLPKGENKVYFSHHFSISKKHQAERMEDFLNFSGRKGFLIIEKRAGKGKSNKAVVLPWKYVFEKYKKGEKAIEINEENSLEIKKVNGYYEIPKSLWTF